MAFHNEEEAELWYSAEKERLDAEFSANIEKDPDNIPTYKAKYEDLLKKTIIKFQSECERLVAIDNSKLNKKNKK
jgi:hypothetical protein